VVFYSFLIIALRKENKDHAIGAVFWFFLFSTILLLPFPFIFGLGDFSGNVLWYVLGLGILSTGFAYLFYNLALEKIGAEISAIVVMITMSLSGILLAFFILSEELNLKVILGGAILILAGVYLQVHNIKFRKAVRKAIGGLGV